MKKQRQSADGLTELEGENIPRPVRKKKGGLRLKAKHHRRLTKTLAAFSACAILVGGTFGINAFFFTNAAPNAVKEGFSTLLLAPPTDGSTPDMYSALENIGFMNGRFRAQETWYSEMSGSVNTMLKQQVNTWKQYADGVLIQTDITTSSLINSAQQYCWVGDRVLWREAAGGPSTYDGIDTPWSKGEPYGNMTVDDFTRTRGLPGTEFSVYVINEETLLDATPVERGEDGTYTQTYMLDPASDKAPAYYINQMMVKGGLSAMPEFEYITVTYTFDESWQVLSSEIEEAYTATKGLDAKCTAVYHTQYEYGTERACSDAYETYYKDYASKPATGAPEDAPLTAADCLAEAFAPVLTQPVTFSLGLVLNGQPLEGLVYVDAADPSALSLRAQLGGLYLEYGDALRLAFGENALFVDLSALSSLTGGMSSALDTDALLEQLGAGTFVPDADGGATLDSTLSLMGLEVPVRFVFDVSDEGISLKNVSAELTLAGMQIVAELAYSQEELPARDLSDAADVTALVLRAADLAGSEALAADVSYAFTADGVPVSLEGSIALDLRTLSVRGELACAYGEAVKTIRFAYGEEGEIFFTLDGMKVRVDADRAVQLVSGLLGADLAGGGQTELSGLLGKLFSLDLASLVAVGENSLVLAGSELLSSLGVDFALGDVQIAAAENGIAVSALGAQIVLSGAEPFRVDADDYRGYVDVTGLLGTVGDVVKNGRVALGGELAVGYRGLHAGIALRNGVLSWNNGFALSFDLTVFAGGGAQSVRVEADARCIRIFYGTVGVDLAYDELHLLGTAFEETYERIAAIVNRSAAGALPDRAEELLEQLGAGTALTRTLAALDLPAFIEGLTIGGASEQEGSIATLGCRGILLDILYADGALLISLDETAVGDVTLSARLCASSAPADAVLTDGEGLLTAADLCEVLDFAGAAVASLASSDLTLSFSGKTTDEKSADVFDISGTLAYHSGAEDGRFPVNVDTENGTLSFSGGAFLFFTLVLDEKAAQGTDLYLDFALYDAHGDGEPDFYISISKFPPDAARAPLRFTVPAGDILTLLAGGVTLVEDTLVDFLLQLGVKESAAQAVFDTLDRYFISAWLSEAERGQFAALGDMLMATLGIDSALDDLLAGIGGAMGDAADGAANAADGALLSSLGISCGEDGTVTFRAAAGTSPFALALTKKESGAGSRLSGIALENISSEKGNTSLSFAFGYDPFEAEESAQGVHVALPGGGSLGLVYADYAYAFEGAHELLRAVAASATHLNADGSYAVNDSFYLSGSVSISALGFLNVTVDVPALAVSLDEAGNISLYLKVSYVKSGISGIAFKGSGSGELSLRGSMVYLRRTLEGGQPEYRVMPLSNFFADIAGQLGFLLNFTDTILDLINKGTQTPPAQEEGTDDYGVILSDVLSSYSFSQDGGNVWNLVFNGGALTDGVMADLGVTLSSEEYAGRENILRSLKVETSIYTLLSLSAQLTYRNPCGVWDGEPAEVPDLSADLDGIAQDIAAFDWSAQASTYFLAPQRTHAAFYADGELVAEGTYWVSDGFVFGEFPSLDGYEKEGYAQPVWGQFKEGRVDAVYEPVLCGVTVLAPVPVDGNWTAAEGGYALHLEMYYGESITFLFGDASLSFRIGLTDNVFDLAAAAQEAGAGSLLWEEAEYKSAASSWDIRVPLTPDRVEYVSEGVGFTVDGKQVSGAAFDRQFTLPAAEAQGYVFLGWYTFTDGVPAPVSSLPYTGEEALTQVHALWMRALSLTVEEQSKRENGGWFMNTKYDHYAKVSAAGGQLAGLFTNETEGVSVSTKYTFTLAKVALFDDERTAVVEDGTYLAGAECTLNGSGRDEMSVKVTFTYTYTYVDAQGGQTTMQLAVGEAEATASY